MSLNLQNRQQVLGIAAMLLVAFWVGDKMILTPLTKSWQERTARISELRRSIASGRQLLERESSLRERWESMQTNTLPRVVSQAEGRVLKAFEDWSQESKISITSVKPQPKQNSDDYMTVEFRVDGFGSLPSVTRFLHDLEKDALALKVDTVELSTRDNDGAQIALGLQVSGLILTPEGQ